MRSDASNCAASSAPSVSTPSNCRGRSSGVSVRKVKMPETSGWPSGVRIGMVRPLWASAAGAARARRSISVQKLAKVFLGMVGLVFSLSMRSAGIADGLPPRGPGTA